MFFKQLLSHPVIALSLWQETRTPWAVLTILCALLLILAHEVFQKAFFMPPCEICVYIRFGFLVALLGGALGWMAPKHLFSKTLAYILGFWGLTYVLLRSWDLLKIRNVLLSDSTDGLFGVQGCSTQAAFPFGIPLGQWFPSWFAPTGDCGFDAPVVPSGAELSGLKEYFVDLYLNAGGWYLIPQWKFMDMAHACLLASGISLFVLTCMFVCWVLDSYRKGNVVP